MVWPVSQDYNEVIQSPQNSFKDPDLRAGEVVTNQLGIPQPCSGNFADVYQMRCPAGRWAVKCFTREVPKLRERYKAITQHLRHVQLPFTVECTFLEEGIRVRGQWYPILKMQWVEGLSLTEFVRQHADKPLMLDGLLQIWARMGVRLRDAGLAHGDLQHGNVLLVPGPGNSVSVKLVDYDGMFVPALANLPSVEVGHPAYQHPQRVRDHTYNEELDRFPLLLIAAALANLKAGGRGLWEKYDNGDNLLFREEDLLSPANSPLFDELLQGPNGLPRELVQKTFNALQGRLETTPLLEDLLPEQGAAAPGAPRAAGQAVRKPVTSTAHRPKTAPAGVFSNLEKPGQTRTVAKATKGPKPSRGEPTTRKPRKALWITGGAAGGVLAVAVVCWAFLGRSGTPPTTRGSGEPRQVAKLGGSTSPTTDLGLRVPPSSGGPARTGTPPTSGPAPRTGKEPPSGPPPSTKRPAPAPAVEELRAGGSFDFPSPGKGSVRRITLARDGTNVLAFYGERQFTYIDLAKRNGVGMGFPAEVKWTTAVLTPDGTHLLVGDSKGPIYLYSKIAGQQAVRIFKGHDGAVRDIAILPGGEQAISCGDDGFVRIWNVATGAEVQSWRAHDRPVSHVQYSADGQRVLTCSVDGKAKTWDVQDRKAVTYSNADAASKVSIAALSPDGARALVGLGDGSVAMWDVADQRSVLVASERPEPVHTIVWGPNGQYALTASGAGAAAKAFLWLVQGDKASSVLLPIPTVAPMAAAFTPDCRRILTGGPEGMIHVLDVTGGPPVLPVKSVEVVLAKPMSTVADKPPDRPVKPSEPVPGKLPVPPEKAVAEAALAVRATFKEEYAKALTGPARKGLAAKLLEQARECKDDSLRRFALFHEARDMAAAVAPAMALQIVEEMEKSYALNDRQAKVAALQVAGKSFDSPAFAKSFHDAAMPILRTAWAEDDYSTVAPLVPLTRQAGVVVRDPALLKTVAAFLAQLETAAKEHDAVRPSLEALKSMPDDAKGNHNAGAFYCFCKQEWDKGLPYLSKGGEADLIAAATKELEKPGDPGDQVSLGDLWAEAAKKHSKHRAAMEKRAYGWYSQAVIDLKVGKREPVEKKVQELARARPDVYACWDHLDLVTGKPVVVGDAYLRLPPGRSVATKKALPGAIEITLVCRSLKKAPRFEVLQGNETLLVMENTAEFLVFRRPANPAKGLRDNMAFSGPMKFSPDTWYTMTCKLSSSGMEVLFNGSAGGRDPGKYDVARPRSIQVRAIDDPLEVRSFTVKRSQAE